MNRLLAPVLFTNLWVAACFSGMVYGLCRHYALEQTFWYAVFAFAGTLTAYQFHRLMRLRQFRAHISTNERLVWMIRNRYLLMSLFALGTLGSSWSLWIIRPDLNQLLLLGSAGAIILLYPLQLPFFRNGMRGIPFLKIVLIAGVWTLCALFPLSDKPFSELIHPIVLVFFATAAQIIPFDIRDLNYDTPGMRTVPQLFGITGARIVATVFIAAASWSLYQLADCPFFVPLYGIPAVVSCWLKIKPDTLLWLEFLWELPLLLAGIVLAIA